MNNSGFLIKQEEKNVVENWIKGFSGVNNIAGISVLSYKQGWGVLELGASFRKKPLCLAGVQYSYGLGTHADSEIKISSNRAIKEFRTICGIDQNENSVRGDTECKFSVWADGKCLAETEPLSVKSQPAQLVAPLGGLKEFTLKVKAVNNIKFAHADWVDCEAVTVDGEVLRLGDPSFPGIPFLPVSFTYGGRKSEDCFDEWGVNYSQEKNDAFILHKFVSQDNKSGLEFRVELEEYKDSPAVLWNVYFSNRGKSDTAILENVKSLDMKWPAMKQKILHYAKGSFNYPNYAVTFENFHDNFIKKKDDLSSSGEISLGAVGGRSSVDWMPYFNFEGEKEGLLFGIGWTGQWQAKINADGRSVSFKAGMEFMHAKLEPGESIRMPSILMIYWKGEALRGNNLLRHFIQSRLLPKDSGGNVLQAPSAVLTWGGMRASSHIARIKKAVDEKLSYDYYWIDAGWYGNCGPNKDEFAPVWASQNGNWAVSREIFPNGIKEVSDAAHAGGKKFLLWVEPERAIYGTPVTEEHPEYFLNDGSVLQKASSNLLLDLGNPEARKWCTETISGIIKNEGLDCYRQDFNISPLPYWLKHDAPDRVGMTEIKYITGLYTFLGELRKRFPDLLIDNCSSGGRRLDFEMMRYSIPLWPSDMQCYPDFLTEKNQQFIQDLSLWLPQFAFGTQEHPGDTNHFRRSMAAGISLHLFTYEHRPVNEGYPYQWLRERLAEYHRAKIYFSGDYYPLTEQVYSNKYWTVNQFHRPDLNAGIVLAFRNNDSDYLTMNLPLKGLIPDLKYEFEDADSGRKNTFSGREIMEKGLIVQIPEKNGSSLYFYHAKQQ